MTARAQWVAVTHANTDWSWLECRREWRLRAESRVRFAFMHELGGAFTSRRWDTR